MERYQSKFEEMSMPLKKALDNITSLEKPINNHLLKILLFKRYSTWKNEIVTLLSDIAECTIKPKDIFLKKGQYFELLFTERLDNGNQPVRKTAIYKRCFNLLNDKNYKKMYSIYRNEEIPVLKWKETIKQFYIVIDDYLSKGILDKPRSFAENTEI